MKIIGIKAQEKHMTSEGDIWPPSGVVCTITIFEHELWVKGSSKWWQEESYALGL